MVSNGQGTTIAWLCVERSESVQVSCVQLAGEVQMKRCGAGVVLVERSLWPARWLAREEEPSLCSSTGQENPAVQLQAGPPDIHETKREQRKGKG